MITKPYVWNFRSDAHVRATLSEASILKRRRKNIIGIQITVISWTLEFLSGSLLLIRHLINIGTFQTVKDSKCMDQIFILIGFFITNILVPGSYLLNDEAKKLFILAKGWTSFFQNHLIKCFQGKEPFNEDNQVA